MEEKPNRRERLKNWTKRNSDVMFAGFLVACYGGTLYMIEKIANYKLPLDADIWETDQGDRAMFIRSHDGTWTRLDYNPPKPNEEV